MSNAENDRIAEQQKEAAEEKFNPDPCPFCGTGLEQIAVNMVSGQWFLFCIVCKANGPRRERATEAYTAWNMRAEID